jgi:glycerol-3-phosphate dehydrogenase (NAD(P)+)
MSETSSAKAAVKKLFEDHEHAHSKESILVFGGGNFGTCLADHLAYLDHRVVLYLRDIHSAQSINEKHRNPKYLSSFQLCDSLKATSELNKELVQSFSVLLFAIPTQNLRSFLNQVKEFILPEQLLLFVNKGLEENTMMMPSKIINDVIGAELGNQCVFLSGPSFAQEIVQREITSVVVASESEDRALRAQKLFHAPFFRVYTSNDPTGVEVAGALKNVIALASGVCHGLGLQQNARAALITRGLGEMTKLGIALGGKPETFLGLAGVGDLMLTASSTKSRNFTVGFRLGSGEKLEDIIRSLGSVAEGVKTAKAAYELFKLKKIDSPIIEEMYNVLYMEKPIEVALKDLLWREASVELFLKQNSSPSS